MWDIFKINYSEKGGALPSATHEHLHGHLRPAQPDCSPMMLKGSRRDCNTCSVISLTCWSKQICLSGTKWWFLLMWSQCGLSRGAVSLSSMVSGDENINTSRKLLRWTLTAQLSENSGTLFRTEAAVTQDTKYLMFTVNISHIDKKTLSEQQGHPH